MNGRIWSGAIVCTLAMAAACSSHSDSTNSPLGPGAVKTNAAPDGTTLKVNAPVAQSPANGATLALNAPVTLIVSNVTPTFVAAEDPKAAALTYKFEVYNAGGAKVYISPNVPAGAGSITAHTLVSPLDFNQPYTWWARAEMGGAFGPWSPRASFVVPPNEPDGYIRGSELYDPLTKGRTVGQIHGGVEWVPNVGLKLLSDSSYVSYTLPVTLREGEMSALITNVGVVSRTEDPKLRVFTMREGDAAINDNIYRMSVDKRGNGAIAWRFLTGPGPYIETVGAERYVYPFHESLTYFVQATWRAGFFKVQYREGGANGTIIYDFGKPYGAAYTPVPHNVFLGSPYTPGDRGEASSLTDMIIRQVWVSGDPRPEFANK
jgi:hypothetical protein